VRRALLTLLACAAVLGIALPAWAITNGRPDGNAHPYVGLAVFDVKLPDGRQVPSHRCSASLLTPTVVLTAGHCTDGTVAARVWFDENVQNNSEYPLSGLHTPTRTSASAAGADFPASPSATSA
jgi:hypothetical protein